jgi:hypothetical protein
MQLIPLTKGYHAVVDDHDFERVAAYKWMVSAPSSNGKVRYAQRTIRVGGKKKTILMHRFITGCPPDLEVDHIDGDGLNNRNVNMKIVTSRENMQNLHMQKSSRFPGVSWDKLNGQWRAQINLRGRVIYLGLYPSEEEAAQEYIKACVL